MTVLDSGFHAVDSGLQSLVGFRIPWAVFRIPEPVIPDSTDKNSRILKFKRIQDSLECWIPRCGFRIPGTGLRIPCQWNLDSGFQSLVGFRIPWAVFWIPTLWFQILRIRLPKVQFFRNPDSLTWSNNHVKTKGVAATTTKQQRQTLSTMDTIYWFYPKYFEIGTSAPKDSQSISNKRCK